MVVLLPQDLDLVVALEKSALEVVFLARNDVDLVLHIAELEGVLLELLLAGNELLGLVIKFLLDLVDIGVEACDGLLEVENFLVFGEQLAFVVLDIVHYNGLVRLLVPLLLGLALQPLNQFFFVLVQVLHQRLQPLHLLHQTLVPAGDLTQLFFVLADLQARLLGLVLGCRQLFAEVE